MRKKIISRQYKKAAVAAAFAVVFLLGTVPTPRAQAQTLTVLYIFTGSPNGAYPDGLVRDSKGNLYGATNGGGSFGYGTVFKLDTTGKETVLHSFTGSDGISPNGRLVRDEVGSLYGTTVYDASGYGTVFKLTHCGQPDGEENDENGGEEQ
jgi:uncharacterized repeat protein (TIGR03803 family)